MQSSALQITPAAEVEFTNCLPAESPDILALAKTIADEYHEPADVIIWRDIFCHDCGANECLLSTAFGLARKAYSLGWAMDFANPVCPICADYQPPVNEDDVRADLYYDELKDK